MMRYRQGILFACQCHGELGLCDVRVSFCGSVRGVDRNEFIQSRIVVLGGREDEGSAKFP